jgi:hypothetical protein
VYLGNDYEVETDGSSTTTRRYDDAGGNKVAEMRYKAYGEISDPRLPYPYQELK